ncbi:MAG: YybH family protein [Candidatus Polarisedimenticolia bacterium]
MSPFMLIALAILTAAAPAAPTPRLDELTAQVRAAETSFAKSMADRNHAAFIAHLSDEAVFFSAKVLRGKQAVADGWKPLFEGPKAPFSWAPERVQVLDSGTLGHTSGPVRDADGKLFGTFNSIWRREPDGSWKIVFDNGCPPCDCGKQDAPKTP